MGSRDICCACKKRPGEYCFASGSFCEECVEGHSNKKGKIIESRWSFAEGTSDSFEESALKYLALRLRKEDLLEVVFRYRG